MGMTKRAVLVGRPVLVREAPLSIRAHHCLDVVGWITHFVTRRAVWGQFKIRNITYAKRREVSDFYNIRDSEFSEPEQLLTRNRKYLISLMVHCRYRT